MGIKTVGRRMLVGFVCFILCAALIGCSSNSNQASGSKDGEWAGKSIKVLMVGQFKLEDSTDPLTGKKTEGVRVLKEEFEKQHPGAKVEFVFAPWDGLEQKVQAMLKSNQADVYQISLIRDMARQGHFEPLESYIEKDNFDLSVYIDGQVEGWKSLGADGKQGIYGLPFIGDTRVLAYDKKIFDQWGVEYLSENPTLEEVLEKAKKMTGKNPETGKQNYGAYFSGEDVHLTLFNTAEAQNGSWGSGQTFNEIKFNFNSPEMVKGLEWMSELSKYAPKGFISDQGNEKWLTEDNNIALTLDVAPEYLIKKAYANKLEDRIGVVQMFNNDQGAGGMFAGSPFAIAKSSEQKDLAWEWIKFSSSEFFQKYLWEQYGLIPVVKSAVEWETIIDKKPFTDPILKAMGTPYLPTYTFGSGPMLTLQSKVQKALTGELDVKGALDQAQQESTEWLERHK